MELIGYIATGIVLVSFLMKNMTHLRVLNSIGGVLFIVYGVLIVSLPVIISNCLILTINIIKLVQERLNKKKTKTKSDKEHITNICRTIDKEYFTNVCPTCKSIFGSTCADNWHYNDK